MKPARTNLSRLKACQKLAGGKAIGRRPRSAHRSIATLKGWQSRVFVFAISGTPSGCNRLLDAFRGCRSRLRYATARQAAQPPANFWQPFRLQSRPNRWKSPKTASRKSVAAAEDGRAPHFENTP